MGSYSGNSEIVEVEDEPKPVGVQGNDRKPPVVKLGYGDSTEDDINQLFEGLCLKNLGKGYGTSSQPGTAASSPLRKNTMKRPISVGMTHPMGTTNAESVSLKQALRDLCISKASEMAAMKRLSMSTSSPRISEVGRIKNLYNSVVVETSGYNNPVDVGRKTSSVETSLMTEESKPSSSTDVPHRLQVTKAKVLSQSVHPKAVNEENQSAHTSSRFQALKSPNQSSNSSLPFVSPAMQECSGATLIQRGETSASRRIGTQGLQSPNQSAISFPISAFPIIQNGTRTTQIQNEADSASRKGKSPALKPSTQSYRALQVSGQTTGNDVGTITVHRDSSFESRQVGNQACKTDMVLRVKDVLTASAHSSGSSEDESELDINGPASTKSKSKPMGSKSIRKGKSLTASSSASGSRVTKTRTPRLVKSVTRNKGSMKKKINQGSIAVSKIPDEDSDISVVSNTGHLICQKCQCSLNNEIVNSNNGFLPSFSTDVDAKVSINNMSNGVIPNVTPTKGNRIVGRTKRNSKSHEKGEFSQSSKSSIGDFSTSTSNSEESNASRPSCCNRPHMSKDARWEAIRHVKREDGVLSLHHFNLLKKLGCGDIGTVYLAELIGSNCCFAIKVMDNEFLARRKKLPRAQTEREILRMLDHPFLPTLYGQFTADNLSCLVMEYCPGGDLHVLRQKQPGRHFTEPAARFYVAEVLLALEYLHMLGIIYRDLKPENILVREDGHIMLTDFDLSLRCNVSPMLLKSSSTDTVPLEMSGPYRESSCMEPLCIEPPCQVACFTPRLLPAAAKARRLKAEHASQVRSLPQLVAEPTDARSNSFVGTHEYLAPEIIKGEGHGAAVDWWMFGVLLYELLYGRTPFKGSGNEETLANVVLQNLKFPDTPFVSFQARDLIRGLLIKEPENRLGTAKGAAEIKQHPFFEGLNWALIRCTIPPELPNFYEYGFSGAVSDGESGKYLECKATGEHLEFELF